MDPIEKDTNSQEKNALAEAITNDGGGIAKNIVDPEDSFLYDSEDSYDAEEDLRFEPYDINNDGRIIKTASQLSRRSWKRPEPGWDVAITVHCFCELLTASVADDATGSEDSLSTKETRINKVEPNLQLEFKLGADEDEGFPQSVIDQAKVYGVDLSPLLHSGIETMDRNERATFIVSRMVNGVDGDGESNHPCRVEYDISLDDWMEAIDLSDRKDGSLVKRIVRDGDGVTEPVEVGRVTIRCRITQKCDAQDLKEETVVYDNLQSQDDPPEEGRALEGPLSFVLDECPFGPGVAAIVKSMRVGEVCKSRLDPGYTPVKYSDEDCSQHHVTIELVEVEELPPVWSTNEIRLKMSEKFKLEGNKKFTASDYGRALRRYEKAIQYAIGIPTEKSSNGDGDINSSSGATDRDGQGECADPSGRTSLEEKGAEGDGFVDLQVAILCNQAACHLKLGDGAGALKVADRASAFKVPTGSAAGMKVAYRRACALEAVGDWDEARRAFKSVLEVDPKNSKGSQGLVRIARAKKAYQCRLRKAFGGCLASGKLDGFASEGREALGPGRRLEDNNNNFNDYGGHPIGAPESPWTDGSESKGQENVYRGDYGDGLPPSREKECGVKVATKSQSPSILETCVLEAAYQEPGTAGAAVTAATAVVGTVATAPAAPASEPVCLGLGSGEPSSLKSAPSSCLKATHRVKAGDRNDGT